MSGLTVGEIAALTGAVLPAGVDAERRVLRVRAIGAADAESLVFAEDEASFRAALASAAGVILAGPSAGGVNDGRVLRVGEPRYAFALCAREFSRGASVGETSRVHTAANVDLTAKLGSRVRVGAGAVIEAGAVVGDDCVIGSNGCRG